MSAEMRVSLSGLLIARYVCIFYSCTIIKTDSETRVSLGFSAFLQCREVTSCLDGVLDGVLFYILII